MSRRRSDKHMICCLSLTAVLLISAGAVALTASLGALTLTDLHLKYSGPLMILGLVLAVAGLVLIAFSVEMCLRLRRQIKRVMDPTLLKTSNLHEVKHWIEPGGTDLYTSSYNEFVLLELISFGWGQFDFDEEARLLDENKLRKKYRRHHV